MGGKLSSYNVKHNDTIEVKKFVPGVINVHISGMQQTFQVNMKGTVRDAANEIAKECGIPNPGGYGLVLLERRSSTSPWLSRRGSQQPKWLDPGATLHSLAITASSQLQLQEFPRFSSFSVERTKAPPLKIIGQGSKSLDALSLGSPNVLNAPKVLPLVSDPNLEERISPDEPSITDIEVLQSREVPTPEGYISEEKPSIIPTSSGTEIQGEADGKEAAFDKGDDTKTVTTAAIRRVLSTEVLLSGQQIDVQTSASPHHMVETVRSPDMQKTPSLSPTTPESVEIKPAIKTRTSSYNSSPNRTIPQDSVLDCKDREERGLRSSSRDSSTMPLSKGTPEEPQIMEEGSNVEELATVLTLKTAPADDESKEDTSNSRVAVTLATHNTTPSNELEKKENTSSPVVLMEAHSTSGGGERGSENGQPNESHSKEKLPYSILKNFVSIGNQPVVSETSPVSDSPSASSQHKTMDMLMKEYAGRTETDAGLNHDPFVVVRRRKPQPKLPEPPEPSRKESKAIEELQAALAGFTFTTYTRRTSVTKKPEVKESSQSSTGRPSCRTETANPVPTENKPSVELQDNTSDVEAKEDMEGIQPKEDTGFGGLNEDISVVEPKGVMGGVEPKEATTDAEPTEKAAGIELKGNTGSDEVEKNAADTESKENRTNDELKEKVEDLPTSAELNSSVANCESKENSTTRELQEDSALPELQEEGLACGLHGSSRSSPQLPKLAGGHLTLNGGPRVDPPMTHPITLLVTEESESFSTEPIVGSPIPSEGRTLSSVGEEFSTITTQEPEDVSNDDTTERSSSLVEENGENTSSSSQQLGNAWTPAGPTGDQKSMSTQRAVGNTDTASQETTPWLQSGGVHKDSVSYSSQQGPSNNTCEWGKDSMKKTLPLPGLASATAVGNRAALLSNDQFVDEYSEQGKSDGLVLSFNNPLRYSNEPEDIAMLQDMWYEEMRSPSPEDNYGRNFRKHQGEIPNSDEEEDPEIMALFTDTSTSSDVGEIEIGVCESSEASPYKPDVEKMEAAVTKTLYTFPRNDGLPQKKVSSLPPSEENEHKVLAHSSEGFKETAKEGVSAMITPSPSHRNTQKDEQNSDNRPAAIKDVGVAGNIVNSSNMQDLGSSSSPQLTIRREPLKFSPDLVSSNQKNVSPAEIRPCRSTDERLEDPSEPPQGSEDHTTRYGTPVPWVGPSVCLTTSFHTWDPTSSRRRHRSTELLEQLENKPLKKGMKSLDNVFSCSTEDDRGIFDFMGQKSSRNVGKIVSSSQPFSSSNHNATATEVKQLPKEIADREEVEALKIPLLSEELSPTDKKKREFHPEQSLLSNKVNLPREPLQVDSPVGEGKSFEEVSEPLLKSVDSLPVESQTNVLSTEEECSEEKCSTEEEQLFSTPVTTITTSCEPPPPCEGQVLQTLSLDTPAARMVENSSNLEENVAVGEQKSSEEVPEPLLKAVDSLPVELQTNVLSTEEECSEEEQPFYSPIAMEVTSNKESQKGEEKSVCVDETESGGSSITLIKVSNEEHGPNEYAKKFESVTIETPPLCQSSADDYKGNHQSLPPLVPIVAVEHPQASIQNNSLPVESLTNALSTEECSEGKATTEEEQPFSTPVVMETSANAPSQGSEGQFVLTMPSDIPVAMVIDSSPNEDESVAGEDIVREGKSSEEVPEPLLIAVNSLPVESQTNVLSTEEECSEEKEPFSTCDVTTLSPSPQSVTEHQVPVNQAATMAASGLTQNSLTITDENDKEMRTSNANFTSFASIAATPVIEARETISNVYVVAMTTTPFQQSLSVSKNFVPKARKTSLVTMVTEPSPFLLRSDHSVREDESCEEVPEPLLKAVDSLPVESQTNVLSTKEEYSQEKTSTEEEQTFSSQVTTENKVEKPSEDGQIRDEETQLKEKVFCESPVLAVFNDDGGAASGCSVYSPATMTALPPTKPFAGEDHEIIEDGLPRRHHKDENEVKLEHEREPSASPLVVAAILNDEDVITPNQHSVYSPCGMLTCEATQDTAQKDETPAEDKSSEEVPEPLLKAVDSLPVESQINFLSTEEECSQEKTSTEEEQTFSSITIATTSEEPSPRDKSKKVHLDDAELRSSPVPMATVAHNDRKQQKFQDGGKIVDSPHQQGMAVREDQSSKEHFHTVEDNVLVNEKPSFSTVTMVTPPHCEEPSHDQGLHLENVYPISNSVVMVTSPAVESSQQESKVYVIAMEILPLFQPPVHKEFQPRMQKSTATGVPMVMVESSLSSLQNDREGKSFEEVPEPLFKAVDSLPVESQINVLSTEEECSEEKSLTEEEQPFSSVTTATTSHQLSQNDTEQNECLEDEKSRVSPVAMVQASAEPSDNNKLKSQAVITDIHSSLPPFIYEHAANMPISHVAMETAHDDVGGVERESSKISQENFWGFEENRKDKNLSCGTRDQLTQQRHFNQLHYDRKPGDISPSSLSAKEFWGLNENSSNIRPSSPDDSTYRHHDNSFAISKDLVSEKTDDHHQDVPCKEEDESFWGFEAKGSGTDIHNAASGPLNDEDILIQQDLQFGEGSRQRVTSPSPSSKEFWGLHGDGDSKMGNTPSNVYTHHQHGSGSTSPSGVLLDTSVTHQRQPTREEGKEFWGFADSPEEPKLSRTSKDQEFHQDVYSLHVNVTKQDISSPSPSSKEFWGLHDNGNSSHGDNDNRSHGGNENGSHGNSDSGNHGNSSTVETPLTQQEVVEEAVAVDHQTHLTMGTKRYSRLTSDMLVNEDFTFEELEAIVKECVSEPRDPTPTTIPSPSCNRTTTIPSPPHTQTTTIPSSPHTQTTTIPSPSHTRTTSIKSPPRDPLANELEKNTVPLHTSPQGQNREAMNSEHFVNISSQEDNYAKQQHSVQVSDDGDVRQDASVSSISGRDVGVHANTISGPMIYVYFGDENGEGEGAAGEGSVTNSISSDVGTQHHTQKSSVSNEITSEMHSERENPSPTGEIPDEIYNSNILYPQGRRASTEEILNFLYPSSPVLERGEEFSFKGVKGESFEFEVGPQTGEFEVGRQEIEVEVGTQEVECEARTQVHEYKGFEVVKHEGELEVVKVGPGGDGEFEGFHEDEQEMKHTNPMSHTHSMGHTHIEYYPHTMDHTHGVDHPRPMDHTHRVDHTHSGVHAEGLSDPDRLRGEETAWTQENNEEEGPTPSHHSTPGPHVQEQAGVQLRRCFVPLRDEPEVVPSAYRQPKASSVRGRKERRRPPFERAQSEEDHLQSRRASSTSSEGPTVTTATNMESTVAERPQRQRRKHHSSGTGVEYKVDYQPVVGGGVYPDHMTSLPDVLDSQRKTASTDTIDDDVFANSRAYGGSRDFPYSRGVPLPYGIQFTGAQTPSWSKLDATSQDRIYNSTDTMLSGHYTSSREVLDSDDEGLTASGHTKDKKWSEGYFGAEHDAREYVKSPPNRHGNKDDDQVSITSQDLNQTRSLDYHNMPYEDIASNYVVLNVIIMDQDIRPFLVNPKRNVSDILRDICATFNIPSPGQWHFCIPKGLQVILQRVRSDSKTMLGGLDVTNGVSKKTQFLLASEIAPKEDTLDGEQPLEDQYTFTQKPYIIHMRKTDGRRRESIDGVYDECDIGLEWPDEEVDARRRCFFQSWCRIVKGDLPVERQVAAEIAALLLQAKFGDFDKKSKKTREFISTFLPEAFSGSKGVAKQVLRIYKRFNGITLERAMNAIIIRCREQPAHDGIFFSVKVVEEKGLLKISKLRNGLFGMCSREIVYLEPKSAKVIFRRSYSEISSVEASKRHFKISFGGHYSDPFAAASPVAFEIMNILKLFIQMQSLPPEFPQFEDSYTQVSQGTVPTMNEHQVELVNIV